MPLLLPNFNQWFIMELNWILYDYKWKAYKIISWSRIPEGFAMSQKVSKAPSQLLEISNLLPHEYGGHTRANVRRETSNKNNTLSLIFQYIKIWKHCCLHFLNDVNPHTLLQPPVLKCCVKDFHLPPRGQALLGTDRWETRPPRGQV